MTDTKEEWIKVGTVLGMMPGGMPSEKTEKFSNFWIFWKCHFFDFYWKYLTLRYFWEGKKLMF